MLTLHPVQPSRGKERIVNVVGLLRISLQEECWLRFGALSYRSDMMVCAFRPQGTEIPDDIGVVPPPVPLVPPYVAIKVADNKQRRLSQGLPMQLNKLPQLSDVLESR